MSASDLQKIQSWIAQLSKKLDQKADKDEMDFKFERVYRTIDDFKKEVHERFTKIDERIEKLNERIEKLTNRVEDLTTAILRDRDENETDLLLMKRQLLKIEVDIEVLKARHT